MGTFIRKEWVQDSFFDDLVIQEYKDEKTAYSSVNLDSQLKAQETSYLAWILFPVKSQYSNCLKHLPLCNIPIEKSNLFF